MAHIFVTYSRRDLDISAKIVQALGENGLDTWIDWKDMPKGESWEQEIYRGIEEADAFLFLISPHSIASRMCNKEIAHAVRNRKRILPVIIQDINTEDFSVKMSRNAILELNWIFCRDGQDDFNKAIEEIRRTIHTDYDWLKYHTKLQVKALDWSYRRDNSQLLRGKELAEAEQQLSRAFSQKDPQPTEVQRRYILKSRTQEDKSRRALLITMTSVLVVFIGMIAYTVYLSRQLAILKTSTDSSGTTGLSVFDVIMIILVFVSVLILAGIIFTLRDSRNRQALLSNERKEPELKEKLKVFLCHSTNDKPKVRQLYDQLKLEKGIEPWLDVEKLLPGVDWDLEIKAAVKASHVVLVCLSINSVNKEGYIQKEIRQALDVADEKPDGTIFIIPLRLEDCEVPVRLQRWQWLNLFEKDSYDKLLNSLRKRADDIAKKDTGIK